MLEVIDRGTCSESHPVPLLFVHGAWLLTGTQDEDDGGIDGGDVRL